MTITVTVKPSGKAAEVTTSSGDTENSVVVNSGDTRDFYVHSGVELVVTELETEEPGKPQPPVGDDNEAA